MCCGSEDLCVNKKGKLQQKCVMLVWTQNSIAQNPVYSSAFLLPVQLHSHVLTGVYWQGSLKLGHKHIYLLKTSKKKKKKKAAIQSEYFKTQAHATLHTQLVLLKPTN